MKTLREENSNFRAKIRRLEEDNARKMKEIDALYNTNKVFFYSIDAHYLQIDILLGWRSSKNINLLID